MKKDQKSNFKPQLKTSKDNKNEGVSNQGKSDSQTTKNRDIKCFNCLGTSYIAS